MRLIRPLLWAITAALLFSGHATAEVPRVVASIKPIHSLVAQVMQGVGEPGLIVEGAASPHGASLKPSQAAEIEEADIVFWVGEQLELFLVQPIATLAARAEVVTLAGVERLTMLPYRRGGPWTEHDESGHDHDHDHDGHSGHDHGGLDMHFWLDPRNGKVVVETVAESLSRADPDNAERYGANAEAALAALDAMERRIRQRLRPVMGKPYVVFHDAYQYFENRFDIPAAGSITVSPETPPGAGRVAAIREAVQRLQVQCVFSEPQFEPAIVATVLEGTRARSGVLDPEGATIEKGPDLYRMLLLGLADGLAGCLEQSG